MNKITFIRRVSRTVLKKVPRHAPMFADDLAGLFGMIGFKGPKNTIFNSFHSNGGPKGSGIFTPVSGLTPVIRGPAYFVGELR